MEHRPDTPDVAREDLMQMALQFFYCQIMQNL